MSNDIAELILADSPSPIAIVDAAIALSRTHSIHLAEAYAEDLLLDFDTSLCGITSTLFEVPTLLFIAILRYVDSLCGGLVESTALDDALYYAGEINADTANPTHVVAIPDATGRIITFCAPEESES